MKRTLYLKLLVSYLIFALLAFLIFSFFTQASMTRGEIHQESIYLAREATQIAKNYASQMFSAEGSPYNIQKQLETISDYNDAQILLVDTDGNIVMDSEDSDILANVMKENYKTIKGFNITDFGSKNHIVDDLYGTYPSRQLIVYATVNSTKNYRVLGYVLVVRSLTDVTLSTNSYMTSVLLSILLVFAASSILLLFFTFVIYRPIRKITSAAGAFAQGDFSGQINVHSNDEIGYLANTLNYMASELNSQEEDQRKFISNVSHDFRSPLTSIKGYCEAMLDGTIPVEMQDRYLNIILSETERLNKLTQSLLDLNRFGQHEIRLDISDFDINRMIKDVLLTFEGVCFDRHLMVDLVLTGEELFVTGDMSKIQQVLYNLIDNAIKFSHQDSSIKIETSIKKDKVFVSVKDNGIGIPSDSLKKIWDRFYKTDASRGRDKRGIGIGLSIVKEIISAHRQNINVVSTEDVGTEFIFSLALSAKNMRLDE